jgi:hypothetical protein
MYKNKLELYSSSDNVTMLAFVHRWRPHLSKNPNEISTAYLVVVTPSEYYFRPVVTYSYSCQGLLCIKELFYTGTCKSGSFFNDPSLWETFWNRTSGIYGVPVNQKVWCAFRSYMYHALFGCTVDWKSCLGVHDDINSKNMSARSEIKVPGRATRDSSTEFVGFLMSGQVYGNMERKSRSQTWQYGNSIAQVFSSGCRIYTEWISSFRWSFHLWRKP